MRVRSSLSMTAAALVAAVSILSVGPAWALPPAVTVTVDQGPAQADPATGSTVTFQAVFSEAVLGFSAGDVTLSGTAGATTVSVTGGPATYTITVSGMTQTGTVIVSIPSGAASNSVGSVLSDASTSADNTVSWTASSDDGEASESSASEPPTIPAWVQAYGRAKDATCEDGWDASWQSWAEPVTGGWVCTRSVPSLG